MNKNHKPPKPAGRRGHYDGLSAMAGGAVGAATGGATDNLWIGIAAGVAVALAVEMFRAWRR